MTAHLPPRLRYVTGPDGYPLTIANLPSPRTKRRMPRRKAEVVAAVRGGLLSLDDARTRYSLSFSEFLTWQRQLNHHELAGLRTTKVQEYRS